MSDIYLQITETPTVVTLSAPVISGALSSTVTVANTVTVALDANSLSALENVTVTVGAAVSISNFPSSQAVTFSNLALTDTQLRASAVSIGGTVTVGNSLTISSLPALAAGTAQIGSVTASISGTVPVSGTFFQGTQPVSLTTLPALVAGTAQIGSVTASISGTVTANLAPQANGPILEIDSSIPNDPKYATIVGGFDTDGGEFRALRLGSTGAIIVQQLPAISGTVTANTFALQGTAVTTSNFTSTTASTVLANYNATREVLTIFNEGAGNLHICAGATCTTIAYQVRLSAGDYYEVPNHQTSLTHSAVFATAGTARVTQVS